MRIQSMSPLLGKEGLNDIVELYNAGASPIWRDIVKEITSKEYFFRVLSEGDMGTAVAVNEATGISYDDFDTPFQKDYYPVKRGIGFAVSTESMETDQYGVIAKRAKKMLRSMDKTIEADVANFVNLATNTSAANLGPDGKPLAASDHPIEGSTASNIITGNPALGYTALETAIQELAQQQSHRGDPMMFMGPYNLYVPPALWMLAKRLTETDKVATTANNDKNVVRGFINKVVPNPYFTSSTAWMLRSADDDEHGLAFINRRGKVTDSDKDIDKDVMKYTLTQIWIRAILDWRGVAYSAGA